MGAVLVSPRQLYPLPYGVLSSATGGRPNAQGRPLRLSRCLASRLTSRRGDREELILALLLEGKRLRCRGCAPEANENRVAMSTKAAYQLLVLAMLLLRNLCSWIVDNHVRDMAQERRLGDLMCMRSCLLLKRLAR